jgi:hypothetical protein
MTIKVKATRLGRIGKFEGEVFGGADGTTLVSSAKFTALVEPKQPAPTSE